MSFLTLGFLMFPSLLLDGLPQGARPEHFGPDSSAIRPAAEHRTGQERRVVVYVSLDEEHSRQILERFEQQSGIRVEANFDTEDNKTVGMVNRIIAEGSSPVADVYWNNECGQTERLKALELLQPYRSPAAATIPAQFKDPDGYWTGFAARARVLVWNRDLVKREDLPAGLEDLATAACRGHLAMAKPLTGTTLTHAGALYAAWGADRAVSWFKALQQNDVRWERGNAQVARVVAEGVRPYGLTDTDDVNVRRLEGFPVEMAWLDQGEHGLGTLLIPNSVMMLKGAPHPEEGRALIDFLLSPQVESLLANGRSAQMPLHPGVPVPEHVVPVERIQAMEVDFRRVGGMIEDHKQDLETLFQGVSPESAGGGGITSLIFALAALILAVVFVILALRPRRVQDLPAP